MNDPQEHQALMEEGIWKLCLDQNNIDDLLQSLEEYPVTTAVDLILTTLNANFCLTESQALRLIRLITCRTIVWHELFLEVATESSHWQQCVCEIAHLFPKITVSMASQQPLPRATTVALCHTLQQDNSRLQQLFLSNLIFSDETIELLSRGIQSALAPSFQRLVLSEVDYTSFSHQHNVNNHPLAVALAENMTLQHIEIRNCMPSSQETLVATLNALVGSLNLRELSLENLNLASTIQTNLLMEALSRILIHPQCRIHTLDLNSCGLGQQPSLQSLLSSLQQNTCIQNLDLSENGLDSMGMTMVLDCIKNMPCLRQVDLNDNYYLSTSDIVDWLGNSSLLEATPSTSLMTLEIDDYLPDNYDSDDDAQQGELDSILIKLLQNNPSLGNLGVDVDDIQDRLSPKACGWLDVNLCGRRLIGTTIPISLWPIILERANNFLSDELERNANVVFYFLQNGQFLK